MNYIFNTNLFTTTGTPSSLSTSLSSQQGTVAIDALSGAYTGLAFSTVDQASLPTLSARQVVTVSGNTLLIASGYHNRAFALLKPNGEATIFTFLSAGGAITPSETTTDLTYPRSRRLKVLGYV